MNEWMDEWMLGYTCTAQADYYEYRIKHLP